MKLVIGLIVLVWIAGSVFFCYIEPRDWSGFR